MSRKGRYLFTSESVTEGHPDKIADQISDAILDAILAQGPGQPRGLRNARHHRPGDRRRRNHHQRATSTSRIVRETINEIGYTRGKFGFDAETCAVLSSIHSQSPDIAMGVDTGRRRGPGADVRLCLHRDPRADADADHAGAQAGARAVGARGASGTLDYLRPDGKSQVTIEYDGTEPVRVDTVVVSTQHSPTVDERDAAATTSPRRSSTR